MSRVKSKDTKPEMTVRRMVFRMGFRYRLHDKTLPGKPDLVFSGRRKVIFVNGCFWHGHEDCAYGRLPKSRVEFWQAKIVRNCARDKNNIALLKESGWRVLVVWQCELRNPKEMVIRLHDFIECD